MGLPLLMPCLMVQEYGQFLDMINRYAYECNEANGRYM